MKIKIKVLLIVFILLLISGFVTTIVTQTGSKNIVEQEIHNSLENIAQSRAAHIETFLELKRKTVDQLSQSVVILDLLLTAKNDENYAKTFNAATKRLKSRAETGEYTYDVFVINKEGIIIASSEEIDIGKNKSGDPYFLGAKQGTFVKDAYVSQDKKIISIAFSAPVLEDNNKEFLGVVVMRYSMGGLDKITTDRTGLGETGEIYLLNKDGYMITPSRFVNDTFLKLKVDTGHSGAELEDVKHLGTQEQEHEVVSGKNYLDRDVIRTHAHIYDMGWVLVVEMSEEEAFAPVAMLTRTMLLILTILLVLGTIFTILLSRTITNPIVKLHQGTEEITKGNLDFKVGTKVEDEIGQLTRNYDSMTAKLKESRAELQESSSGLEEKVKERTKELDEKVKASEEQAIATLNLLEDVNETKNKLDVSRQALQNMAHDLDKEKREAESAKEALEVTNIKLERSNKELQDFTYIASHDLREPLRKISAFGQLLQESLEGKLDEDEEENFAFMIDGATRMQHMVNDLLVYSRVTTKAKPPERVDLNAVIDDLKNVELAVRVEETGGVINVPELLPPVDADPSQIHQLLQNLLGNGLKYCRKGVPPVITVRGRVVNGNMVCIEVQDNGIGIEEQYCANIFGMFKRLHSREDYEGSGIGLAVCKKIVERHGGEIGVESNPGVGSTFWFTVPITIDELEIQRNRWDVLFDILGVISWEGGVQKTNLDLSSVKRYFDFLMDNGFLEAGDEPGKWESYKLTEKGQDLLLKLQRVAEMIRGRKTG
jgi:signal transduction histidine kinase